MKTERSWRLFTIQFFSATTTPRVTTTTISKPEGLLINNINKWTTLSLKMCSARRLGKATADQFFTREPGMIVSSRRGNKRIIQGFRGVRNV